MPGTDPPVSQGDGRAMVNGVQCVTATVAISLLAAGAARAGELASAEAASVTLGHVDADVYYTSAPDGFRVVATLAAGEQSVPVRFVAILLPGQTVTISVPGPAGTPAQEVFLTRRGDHLVISRPNARISEATPDQ